MHTNVSCLIVRRIYYQNNFFISGTSASFSVLLTLLHYKLGRDSNNWVATCCQEALDLLAGLGFDKTVDAKRIS
jgi:hypothetical protein